MSTIVTTKELSKKHGNVYSVKDLDLNIYEGEVYGFLGPNGAGKSTTLKMLLGLVKPTEGEINIFGKDMNSQNRIPILKNIGSLIESPSFYGHLTGMENMIIMQKLLNLPKKNILEALRIVRLEGQRDKKVNHYSLGMKQRLGIAMAIANFPKLLILDEPTNGLDPAGIGEIRELIKSLPKKYGITVLISSHLLSEIEQIATQVGIINHGELVFQDSMAALQNQSSQYISLRVNDTSSAKQLLLSKGFAPSIKDNLLLFENMEDAFVTKVNRLLVDAGFHVFRIEEHRKNLEDIFIELTGKTVTL